MTKKKNEIPTVRDLVCRGVAIGMTRAELLRTFRIYPNQLKHWLNDEQFMEDVRKFREQHFELLDIKIVDLYEKALSRLNNLLDSDNEYVQLSASKSVISSRLQFKPKETNLNVTGKIEKDEKTEDDIYMEKLRELRIAKGLSSDVIDVTPKKTEKKEGNND